MMGYFTLGAIEDGKMCHFTFFFGKRVGFFVLRGVLLDIGLYFCKIDICSFRKPQVLLGEK